MSECDKPFTEEEIQSAEPLCRDDACEALPEEAQAAPLPEPETPAEEVLPVTEEAAPIEEAPLAETPPALDPPMQEEAEEAPAEPVAPRESVEDALARMDGEVSEKLTYVQVQLTQAREELGAALAELDRARADRDQLTELLKAALEEVQTARQGQAAMCEALDKQQAELLLPLRNMDIRMKQFEHQQRIIDDLRAENTAFKEDQVFKLLRPALNDMMELRESIRRMARDLYKKEGPGGKMPIVQFESYADDFMNLLEEYEIEVYTSLAGEKFQPGRQVCSKRIPTAEKDLHGIVAEVLTDGYLYKNRVLRPQKVSVYLYEAPKDEAKP